MKINCPYCNQVYAIDPSKISSSGAYATCKKCRTRFLVKVDQINIEPVREDDLKQCPFCAEQIKKDALKCKHCGEWLSKSEQAIPNQKEPESQKSEDRPPIPNEKPLVLDERIPCEDEQCIGTINFSGVCTECNRTREDVRKGVTSNSIGMVVTGGLTYKTLKTFIDLPMWIIGCFLLFIITSITIGIEIGSLFLIAILVQKFLFLKSLGILAFHLEKNSILWMVGSVLFPPTAFYAYYQFPRLLLSRTID